MSDIAQRTYCSEASSAEPMAGTAANVDVWLLLEYRPVWRAKAHGDNELKPVVRTWLDAALTDLAARGFKPRLQFVRQPEIDSPTTRLLLATKGRLLEFEGIGYDFLSQVDVVSAALQPERFPALDAPRYFVCTNGRRDLCCARFGLRTYAALRELVGERAWQVTHLGGHRFAPNVLALPSGVLYGRVTESDAADFVRVLESGAVDFDHLRGRCRYPAHVQAAEALLERSDLRLLHVDGDEQSCTVTFSDGHEALKATVVRSAEPMRATKSCGADEEEVYPYRPG